MTRREALEERLLRALDGELGDREAAALADELAREPDVAAQLIATLDAEAALRAMRDDGRLPARVLGAIAAAQAGTVDAVMQAVGGSAARGSAGKILVLAGAAAVGAAALVAGPFVGRRPPERAGSPPARSAAPGPPRLDPRVLERVGAPALASPPAPPPEEPAPTLAVDFEDGALPAEVDLHFAAVVPCPAPRGARACALAGLSPDAPRRNTMMLVGRRSDPDGFGTFGDDAVLEFSYFLGGSGRTRLVVQVKDRDQWRNHHLVFDDAPRGAWTLGRVRLADLRPNSDGAPRAAAGDVIHDVTLVAGQLGGGGFLVDELRIRRFPPGAPLPATGLTEDPAAR